MQKKILSIVIILMVISIAFPLGQGLSSDSSIENYKNNGENESFVNCYIEASGHISKYDWSRLIGSNNWKTFWFRPFNNYTSIVTYWQIVFDTQSDIKIYDLKDGNLLWENPGLNHVQLRIFGYYGTYIASKADFLSPLHIELDGKIKLLTITLR